MGNYRELWEVSYCFMVPSHRDDEFEGGTLYVMADSEKEAIERAKTSDKLKDIKRFEELEAKRYELPELSLPEDREKLSLRLLIENN